MRNLILLIVAVTGLSSCEDKYELQINREYRRAQPDAETEEYFSPGMLYKKLENGFVEGSFYVPSSLMDYAHENGIVAADPFADREPFKPGVKSKRLTTQEFLEQAGVQFEKGTSVKYLPSEGILTAILPED